MFLVRSLSEVSQEIMAGICASLPSCRSGGVVAVRLNLESFYALTLHAEEWLSFVVPDWLGRILENVVGSSGLPLDTQVLTVVGW